MGATVDSANPDGTFNVVDQATGQSMPATLDQLAPHPDLHQQAVDLSLKAVTQPLVPAAQPEGLASLGQALSNAPAAPLAMLKNVVTKGPDALMAGLLSPQPVQMVAAPLPVTDALSANMDSPTVPDQPAAAPAPAAAPVPRGTVRASPVVVEPPAPAAAPVQSAATTPAESDDDATLRQQEAEKGRINQAGINREQDTIQSEALWQEQNRQAMAAESQRYQQLRDQALAAHNIDPNKFWQDKGVLGSLLFKISAMFSGAAGGLNGHPEAGVNQVERAIQQNVEQQEKKAASLDKAADAQGNLVQLGRQMGLDHRAATLAAIPLMREMTAKSLEQTAYKLGPGGNSAAFIQAAQGLREKNAAVAKTQNEGALAGANAVKSVVETGLAPARARAENLASQATAAQGFAGAKKTTAETANIIPIAGAVQQARDLAAKGQPIPVETRNRLPPEIANQISADGYWVGGENAKPVNDITSKHYSYDAALQNFQNLVAKKQQGQDISGQELKDAGEGVANSAKDFFGIKRGQGEDQKLVEVQPGLAEAVKASAKDLSPGAMGRYLGAVKGARRVANVVTNGSLKTYRGHPGIPMPLDVISGGAPNLSNAVPSK